MCGRFNLFAPPEEVAQIFGLNQIPRLEPRYNIAPSEEIPAVRSGRRPDTRELVRLRWGLVPSWADDPDVGFRTINARAETVRQKPSFKESFRTRRCLIPASGFYEWKAVGRQKQPFMARVRGSDLFAMAGLWDAWEGPDGVIQSCTIITTPANDLLAPVHDRMPLILDTADFGTWINTTPSSLKDAADLCVPFPGERMEIFPVSQLVNKIENDSPELVERAAPIKSRTDQKAEQLGLF